ncbi:MAG: DNA mismatch repair protein MutS [Chlamydiota bacterium]
MTLTQKKLSPMMAQWYHCKKQAKEALLLFRLGDFYEAFYDDASILADELGLTLTKRQGIPMSGVPARTIESYLEKLVAKGFLIAIAEQIEDPKAAKGLVKREIVRTVSPGTITNESFLHEKTNNFFACLTHINATFALALLDLSTGEFSVLEIEGKKQLQDELFCRRPSEILIAQKTASTLDAVLKEMTKQFSIRIDSKEDHFFDYQQCHNCLTCHFKVESLDMFGFNGMTAAILAAGALLNHVQSEMNLSIAQITDVKVDHLTTYMAIDQTTQRNLELTEPLHAGSANYTLLKLLDRTKTPMGGRLLRTWLTRPLLSTTRIHQRQAAVKELLDHPDTLDALAEKLSAIRDLKRLIMRIASHYGSPRDFISLTQSLAQIPAVFSLLDPLQAPILTDVKQNLPDLSSLITVIERTLTDHPPAKVGDGPIIRDGFHAPLDELRQLKADSQSWIANYQQQLKEATEIKTLKIIYSKAFGYCIEVSRGQAHRIPASFDRRQTLVNAERFISPELKSYEEKILTAEEKIAQLEQQLFQNLRCTVAAEIKAIRQTASSIAIVDCLLSLAELAKRHHYVCPQVDDSSTLFIREGRHPVIEAALPNHTFIPNDTELHPDRSALLLITGPNMGGKSTYIRQVALIAIMAQMGSFIPAQSAQIGVVDKVFSRIGASDDLSRGQSTFMVEMTETAHILTHATPHSLVILDEVGRGTSTCDGIALASAVAQYLIQLQGKGAKTLFATHYLEITKLENQFPQVKNFNVAIRESNDSITFLHKIVPGSADKSYGIHVAKLANFPAQVIKRAEETLKTLEQAPAQRIRKQKQSDQLTFFDSLPPKKDSRTAALIEELQALNLSDTTPIKALQILLRWQQLFS